MKNLTSAQKIYYKEFLKSLRSSGVIDQREFISLVRRVDPKPAWVWSTKFFRLALILAIVLVITLTVIGVLIVALNH